MKDRPHIIYIVCHDLGRMLGCYGREFQSPHLDRFASQGALMTRTYCTTTACSPSRGCAWTGQYAHTNGLMGLVNRGWSLPVERRTIVDDMNAAGYHTALVGLDHIRKFREDHRFKEYLPPDARTAVAADNAIAFLKSRRGNDQPFYLNMGTIEVHGSQWGTYHANREKSGADPLVERYGWSKAEDAPVPPTYKDHPAVRREMANYQGCISYLDFHLGRLFNAIDRLGFRDNTLVMFNADHGMEGLRGKGTLYELGLEIACLMRGPGIAPGTVVDHMIQNIDYVPTFLDAIGANMPDGLQGRSFWPALTGGTYIPHEKIYAERNYHGGANSTFPDGTPSSFDPMRSVRTKKYRLIQTFGEGRRSSWTPENVPEVRDVFTMYPSQVFPGCPHPREMVELFDLEKDPYCWRNIANDPACAAVRDDLVRDLDAWRRETKDPLLDGPIPDELNPWPDAPSV